MIEIKNNFIKIKQKVCEITKPKHKDYNTLVEIRMNDLQSLSQSTNSINVPQFSNVFEAKEATFKCLHKNLQSLDNKSLIIKDVVLRKIEKSRLQQPSFFKRHNNLIKGLPKIDQEEIESIKTAQDLINKCSILLNPDNSVEFSKKIIADPLFLHELLAHLQDNKIPFTSEDIDTLIDYLKDRCDRFDEKHTIELHNKNLKKIQIIGAVLAISIGVIAGAVSSAIIPFALPVTISGGVILGLGLTLISGLISGKIGERIGRRNAEKDKIASYTLASKHDMFDGDNNNEIESEISIANANTFVSVEAIYT